jgi:hypothetical protein
MTAPAQIIFTGPRGPSGDQGLRFTTVTSSGNYTLLTTDMVVLLNKLVGEATTVTLNAPTVRRKIWVKDIRGDASIYPIIIAPPSGTIDGLPTVVISEDWGSRCLVSTGSVWTVL